MLACLRKKTNPGVAALAMGLVFFLSACGGSPSPRAQAAPDENAENATEQQKISDAAMGALLRFHFSDFYSLTQPEKTGNKCAGDTKFYYDPFDMESTASGYQAARFPLDIFDETRSIRPSFIKGSSVDLTDANAAVTQNESYSCSYATTPGSPPPSSCATFDYGAIGGIPSNMGGALFLIGGIQGLNYGSTAACGIVGAAGGTNTNTCSRSTFALAIDSIPASTATDPPSTLVPGLTSATGPISSWANFGGAYDYAGPEGVVGGATAYSPSLQKLIVFGGATYANNSTYLGQLTNYTWSMNLAKQTWTLFNSNFNIAASLLTTLDYDSDPDGNPATSDEITYQLSKSPLGKAHFGYVGLQGASVTSMSATGAAAASINTTDQIVIVGGIGGAGVTYTTHRFNPTYAPSWMDIAANGTANTPVQWLDSYHTQLLNNDSTASSKFKPTYGADIVTPDFSYNFGLAPLRNNGGVTAAGYLLSAGGFDFNLSANTAPLTEGGALMISGRNTGETASRDLAAVTNNIAGIAQSPLSWREITEGDKTIPFYGGSHLLPGFDLSQNEVVYFGGASCKNFLNDSNAFCTGVADFDNPGFYYRLGATPADINNNADTTDETTTLITNVAEAGTSPDAAGMAAARGLDAAGNVVIVAWGGNTGRNAPATATDLHFLYNNGGTPTWVKKVNVTGGPSNLTNAALVYSHVAKAFYLFGGYNVTVGALSSDTWKLTIGGGALDGDCSDGACIFTWTQLSTSPYFACSPVCPSARQGHRMVEVNYNNKNPGGTVGGVTSGENTCTDSASPCSFGIFMEGGSTVGATANYFQERWMFDPTANGGWGLWQRMGEVPPRAMAAMSSVEYTAINGTTARRAIMFGGETGMINPGYDSSNSYIPPTLGDTLIYDFANDTWNRATLFGKGYLTGDVVDPVGGAKTAAAVAYSSTSELELRQAYSADDTSATAPFNYSAALPPLTELSPPPLSGAIMVTRTMPQAAASAASTVTPLKIPEVFLFGGRTKDGHFNELDHVYKFCTGSTGEKPLYAFDSDGNGSLDAGEITAMAATDTAACDAYDEDENPNSPSPTTNYVGRWLRKAPAGAAFGSFMGAGTYDSVRDRIILVGGKQGEDTDAVTEAAGNLLAQAELKVYEYTPPSKTWSNTAAEVHGAWTEIGVCSSSTQPSPRYAHTLNYDPLTRRLVMVGGLKLDGTAATQSVTYYAGTYTTPEVWTASRSLDVDGTTPCYNWTLVTLFGNVPDIPSIAPPQTGLAHMSSIFIPSSGYNTGYYTLQDTACYGQGPIANGDAAINKLLAGGVYIDIDHDQLGPNENMLLNLSFFPLNTNNSRPDGNLASSAEAAVFKIHLMRTGRTGDELLQFLQPRHLSFSDTETYPQIVHTLSIIAPPSGEPQDEQILLPVSMDSRIDRIRIERYSGSAILLNASVFRLGYR